MGRDTRWVGILGGSVLGGSSEYSDSEASKGYWQGIYRICEIIVEQTDCKPEVDSESSKRGESTGILTEQDSDFGRMVSTILLLRRRKIFRRAELNCRFRR